MSTPVFQPLRALLALLSDRTFYRWALVSLFSFCLVLSTTFVLREVIGASERVSFGVALCLATGINFCTIKFFVFSSAQRYEARHQFVLYVITTLCFRLSEYALYWVILDVLSLHYLIAAVVVMGTAFLGKFFVSKFIIFKSHA